MMSQVPHRHVVPSRESPVRMAVTPASAGWTYVGFSVLMLGDGESTTVAADDRERAIVPLSGAGAAQVGGSSYPLARTTVFEQMPDVLYAPPGFTVELTGPLEVAIGSAPAEGRYPVRLFRSSEMRSELRGGGAAYRQVNHLLNAPLPAERLIVFEVYVPRGTWSGWAPHCHDGRDGSPYLEETYYFRLDPADGFAMHRNWRDGEDGFDELFSARDGECVLVPGGYHSSVACPSSHMYFLNVLAGELLDDARSTPPCFHSAYTWIQDDWSAGAWELPVVGPTA
jgi:5-deoxy-glucuronate isomerase